MHVLHNSVSWWCFHLESVCVSSRHNKVLLTITALGNTTEELWNPLGRRLCLVCHNHKVQSRKLRCVAEIEMKTTFCRKVTAVKLTRPHRGGARLHNDRIIIIIYINQWFNVCALTCWFKQVAFDANRFAVCFNGAYQPGVKNDCIVMSGGTADRGNLSVLTKEIPTGSGLHKLLPSLKNAGKCVNVIPLKDSQDAEVSQSKYVNDAVLLWNIIEIFQPAAGPVLRRLCVFYVSCWQIEQVELGNFGTQAVLSIKTYSGYTNVDVVSPRETKQGCHTFIYL